MRTNAEWSFVGLPDLSQTGKQPVLIQWQVYPAMQPNPKFGEALEAAHLDMTPISISSAAPAPAAWPPPRPPKAAGYKHVYNVKDGFEGPPDARNHRGAVAGWKSEGLPWKQGSKRRA